MWNKILAWFPEVEKPLGGKLSFNTKLKWTGIVLVLYFTLSNIPLFGLGDNALAQFNYLSTILGASFGSLISLGIGPIVTASIILQLLVGAGLMKLDGSTPEGRTRYEGIQKVMIVAFILLESAIYVFMGGFSPSATLVGYVGSGLGSTILVAQLCLGGLAIMLMDEVTTKWGFGSGISLFIAAGVATEIFMKAFNPLKQGTSYSAGAVLRIVQSIQTGDLVTTTAAAVAIIATIVVFMLAIYGQSMRVEIPLSFGRVRGYGMRWPLRFMYTSNIPVILLASLLATLQLFARLLENWGHPLLGTFQNGVAVSGLARWIDSPNITYALIAGNATGAMVLQTVIYIGVMIIGAIIFSVMWVKTANMDSASVAKQMLNSGMQIPGFRRDTRVLESVLNRYIPALTVMGGALVGLLAAVADLSGALSRGTGILLTVMIIYKMYEDIAKQHAYDMNPALRKVMGTE